MTEADHKDKLLQDFFSETKQEVADNGFSRRVMNQLPTQSNLANHMCTTLMSVLGVILFITQNGFEIAWGNLRKIALHVIQQPIVHSIEPKSLFIVTAVLLVLGTRKLISMT